MLNPNQREKIHIKLTFKRNRLLKYIVFKRKTSTNTTYIEKWYYTDEKINIPSMHSFTDSKSEYVLVSCLPGCINNIVCD